MQPFENAKDLLVIARIDPDTVVSNGELGRIAAYRGGNMNPGWLLPPKAQPISRWVEPV